MSKITVTDRDGNLVEFEGDEFLFSIPVGVKDENGSLEHLGVIEVVRGEMTGDVMMTVVINAMLKHGFTVAGSRTMKAMSSEIKEWENNRYKEVEIPVKSVGGNEDMTLVFLPMFASTSFRKEFERAIEHSIKNREANEAPQERN